MTILRQIQEDLLKENSSLPTTLRRALVLASELKSEKLKNWASQELNGYKQFIDLPDYRRIATSCVGTWTNGFHAITNHQVPTWRIDNPKLVNALEVYAVFDGIASVEELASNPKLNHFISAEMLALVNHAVMSGGYGYLEIHYGVSANTFRQLLDTVKNRLLEFVLELNTSWDLQHSSPTNREVEQLVAVYIYNQVNGGSMATFDQRGQSVGYQYNAAGDINFGPVQNRAELVNELTKLTAEFDRAAQAHVFSEEVAIAAGADLKLLTVEAKKPEPNQQTMLQRLNSAKTLIKGVTATAGLVTALTKASELIQKLF